MDGRDRHRVAADRRPRKEVEMATKRKKRTTTKVKTLKSKSLSSEKARDVRGGALNKTGKGEE
jgi:hypothetical protein